MAPSIENVEIGSVTAFVDGSALGHTKGGGTLNVTAGYAELRVDEYPTPVDWALNALSLTFKIVCAEPTLTNLGIAMPHTTALGSTGLGIGRKSGFRLSSTAKAVRLHLIDKDDSDFSKDIYIWKAVAKESVELGYNNDDQRLLEITFEAIPDETAPNGNLGRIGIGSVS